MTIIHEEIPTGKCATFDIDFQENRIKIILINTDSLKQEALVFVDLKYLYNPFLFKYSTKTNTFAYLVHRN
jgi:hypothetical protein